MSDTLLQPQPPNAPLLPPPSRREEREEEKRGIKQKKRFYIYVAVLISEGISELVGTMFTVKHFAQASLPPPPPALPHTFSRENMFNLTGGE